MNTELLINIVYILSSVTFILGLKMMTTPEGARRGNWISGVGMVSAILVTAMHPDIVTMNFILIGGLVGSILGALAAYTVPMTGMPGMVGLLNGSGGLASLLVGWAEYHAGHATSHYDAFVIFLTIIIGAITFSGSVVAWAKLEEKFISGKPLLFKGQHALNALLLIVIVVGGSLFTMSPADNYPIFIGLVFAALILGITLVIPIGGADMPVVICILNSYSGMAGCASGFVVINNLLIVAGALVGASGIILTLIMCKAMNRSVANVFFGGFGSTTTASGQTVTGEIKPIKSDDLYPILEAAGSVVIVPGYGMAVSQAQHVVRELGELLEKNGAEVRYAIHPVAGRMPGHMNILLAEANISYDHMAEMDAINPSMENVDVCIIIGANDVVNPAANDDKTSPLYGMPIIEAQRCRTVVVLKRSMNAGFAGVENPLFYKSNTRMLFGDAKASIQALINEFKSST